jgi:hypothetical protein
MEQQTAPMSGAIKAVTGLVLVMTAGFLWASLWQRVFLIGGLALAAVSWFCYLYAPVAYELTGHRLVVRRRFGERAFSPVVRCARLQERLGFGLRLWGNGGLFAATGIFWNRRLGVFRSYVTSCRPEDLVLVETKTQKIIISPENAEELVRMCPGHS